MDLWKHLIIFGLVCPISFVAADILNSHLQDELYHVDQWALCVQVDKDKAYYIVADAAMVSLAVQACVEVENK